jgi:endonuclease YncB( thermonuclease family)
VTRPKPEFSWPVKEGTHRALDGDTVEVVYDLGCWETRLNHVRLDGLDTPESFRPKSQNKALEKQVGLLVKAVVVKWLSDRAETHQLYGSSTAKPKYAKRSIGVIYAEDSGRVRESLNAYLLDLGLAKPYQGGKRGWTEDELFEIRALATVELDKLGVPEDQRS